MRACAVVPLPLSFLCCLAEEGAGGSRGGTWCTYSTMSTCRRGGGRRARPPWRPVHPHHHGDASFSTTTPGRRPPSTRRRRRGGGGAQRAGSVRRGVPVERVTTVYYSSYHDSRGTLIVQIFRRASDLYKFSFLYD